jgi:hypothetical protein
MLGAKNNKKPSRNLCNKVKNSGLNSDIKNGGGNAGKALPLRCSKVGENQKDR